MGRANYGSSAPMEETPLFADGIKGERRPGHCKWLCGRLCGTPDCPHTAARFGARKKWRGDAERAQVEKSKNVKNSMSFYSDTPGLSGFQKAKRIVR